VNFSVVFSSFVAVVCLAPPALAQSRPTTLDELQQDLATGDRISLIQTDGEAHTGQVLRLGSSDLIVRTITQPSPGQARRRLDLTIPFDSIQSLERPRDSVRNGVFIGALVGAGFVGTMFARAVAVDRNEIDEWGPIYLAQGALFTGVGALIGWAIDKAHSKPAIRFDRPSNGRRGGSLDPP
jgi:hypothetical protein